MRTYLTEKNIVIALFIVVLITFSLAQEDSRKFDKTNSTQTAEQQISAKPPVEEKTTAYPASTRYVK